MDLHFSTEAPSSAQFWWNVAQGATAAVLAGFGAFIAWRQVKNAEYKTKLDLFDRRYAVYDAVFRAAEEYIHSQDEGACLAYPEFDVAIWRSRFLFEQPVTDVLFKIRGLSDDLACARQLAVGTQKRCGLSSS